jgi:outer membrane protein OmpA-like peptidoglycan-associated protein
MYSVTMLRKLLTGSLAFSMIFASHAWATGGQEGDIEIGGYAGYGILDDYSGQAPKNNLLYGVRLGYFIDEYFSFEPSYQILFTDTERAAPPQNSVQIRSLRFNLLYNLAPEAVVRPFFTGGLGWENTRITNTVYAGDLGVNVGAGLRWFVNDAIAVRLDGRFIYTEVGKIISEREYNYEAALGVSYLFGGKPPADTDGDGVKDKKDACPETPKGATVNDKGCPSDADLDGVFDGLDQCADTPRGTKVNDKGCPADSDGDGVTDDKDKCPDTAKGVAVDEKGCTLDDDVDGVPNDKDQCPDTPVEAKVDEKGCPVDSDLDGVTDDKDKCPDTRAKTKVDGMGCPLVTKSRGVLKGVNFVFGKTDLTTSSKTVLEAVAKDLNEFPNVRVEVQGHTDSVGPAAANIKLSQGRAQTVADYLVLRGVDRTRLDVKGYGPSKPIAPNKTKEGRAKNRRVELNWLDENAAAGSAPAKAPVSAGSPAPAPTAAAPTPAPAATSSPAPAEVPTPEGPPIIP